ncbi:MAG: branched-chain amino acid ABC transporter permease [Desulfobacterales bacterium]|nr:branched-chain amino acid ABC transporter permease [Desulfobacterales bacterium]
MPILFRRYGIWVVAILVSGVLPLIFKSSFSISLFSQMGISIIFALSYNMLLGQGGMLSFGHAVYLGLGGFLAMHGLEKIGGGVLPLPLELLPLVGGMAGILAGVLFGWLSTDRAGTTFALISLGIGELIAASALMLPSFFGGEEGIASNRMVQLTLTGFKFGKSIEVYYLIACWMLLSVALMYLLTKTPLGRVANAVRDNPERAAFIGYNPRHVRTIQFTLAAFFAGLAGGLFAINYEIITAETVGAQTSGSVLMMTYIGGVGHFFGPIMGAVLVILMQQSLAGITHAWLLYFGLLFVMMVLWAPNGMAGLIMLHEPVWRAGLLKRLLPAYLTTLLPLLVMFAGIMLLVEINYHLSLSINPDEPLALFGIAFNARSPLAWALAIVLAAVGFFFFRKASRRVNESWNEVTQAMKGGR